MSVKLNKTLRTFVQLVAFAARENLKPFDVAELVALASRAFDANVRHANGQGDPSGPCKAFEDKAASLGYGTDWAGRLWPGLSKGGEAVDLPSLEN